MKETKTMITAVHLQCIGYSDQSLSCHCQGRGWREHSFLEISHVQVTSAHRGISLARLDHQSIVNIISPGQHDSQIPDHRCEDILAAAQPKRQAGNGFLPPGTKAFHWRGILIPENFFESNSSFSRLCSVRVRTIHLYIFSFSEAVIDCLIVQRRKKPLSISSTHPRYHDAA
jgi:hypothetical protein